MKTFQRRTFSAYALTIAALALSGCTQMRTEPETRVISVPSSKPYRYLKYTAQCDASTIGRIKTHNATHWKVKQAEAEALKQSTK